MPTVAYHKPQPLEQLADLKDAIHRLIRRAGGMRPEYSPELREINEHLADLREVYLELHAITKHPKANGAAAKSVDTLVDELIRGVAASGSLEDRHTDLLIEALRVRLGHKSQQQLI